MKRYLVQELTRKKLGLVWEADLIERDAALNENMVFPELVADQSLLDDAGASGNFIIEGDNFDSLRMLKATHAGKIRVILIDPPYNTGNKDWVYNDSYMKKDDRWKHSTWLEFMYQRMVLARDLLTPDGVIMICINDDNRSRLELMMDEVMPGRRVGSMVWKKRRSSNASGVEHFFSTDHEHILVYAGSEFAFKGGEKDWSKYNQWDEHAQDWWTSTQLTLGFNRVQRKNLFYPLHNPITDIWYPCNPDRVWARASRIYGDAKTVRTEFMEDLVASNGVHFPVEESPAVYQSVDEIKSAIADGTAPPHLSSQDDLEWWVNKKIGYAKPRFKTYKSKVQSQSQPLSSIIAEVGGSRAEEVDVEQSRVASGLTSEGTRLLRSLEINDSFPYPKPLSLMKSLLDQVTLPNDTVLDFFAGSGTTGHAVLALNAEDGGNRKFILCSSTEATPKEPTKNLCRDVCAERIRRVINGYGKTEGLGGDFAYLTLTLMEEADLLFDATPEHAYAILCIRETGQVRLPDTSQPVWPVSADEHAAIVVCPALTADSIESLSELGASRLVVYTDRPERLQEAFDTTGIEVTAYSLEDALRWGQMARQRDIAAPPTLDAEVAQ
ncbi:MAG: site-specific DNA-methyltransferase [Halomonadaceae bacterium]|nr:site-specific DNA-methyltransferase [Halomonadaceae bacterium]